MRGNASGFTRRVDVRQRQQAEFGIGGLEVRAVEARQVVTEQEGGTLGEVVEALERGGEITAAEVEDLVVVTPDGYESVDAAVALAHLQIDGEAPWRELGWLERCRHGLLP